MLDARPRFVAAHASAGHPRALQGVLADPALAVRLAGPCAWAARRQWVTLCGGRRFVCARDGSEWGLHWRGAVTCS